jgi:hypothetical protein
VCSVLFVSLCFVPHDHADLYADPLDEGHTDGCWGLLPDSDNFVVTMVAGLLWWQQARLPLAAPWGVFHPPRPRLRQFS